MGWLHPRWAARNGKKVVHFCGESGVTESSSRESGAFEAVVLPVGATHDTSSNKVSSSGWASTNVNLADPVEVALAARVQLIVSDGPR